MFKRRTPQSWMSWARSMVWPRKGWRRGFQYVGRRVQRLNDTPHSIALGFAFGALISFTPLFGFHMIGCLALAWAFRGNLLAAAVGQFVGNAFTIGPIAVMSVSLGRWMLGRTGHGTAEGETILQSFADLWATFLRWIASEIDEGDGGHIVTFGRVMRQAWRLFDEIFWPYLIGGLIPGILCALLCYYLVYKGTAAFQKRRVEKRVARIAEIAAHRAPLAPREEGGAVGKRALQNRLAAVREAKAEAEDPEAPAKPGEAQTEPVKTPEASTPEAAKGAGEENRS